MITTTQVESEIAQNLNMYKRADNRGKAQLIARNKELRTVLDYLKSGVNEDQLRLQLNKVETLIDRHNKAIANILYDKYSELYKEEKRVVQSFYRINTLRLQQRTLKYILDEH